MLRSDDSAFLSGLPFTWRALLAIGLATALALGCTPKIGDDCTVSTNCSTTGDRLCDITQPGGYCTTFNCEPGSCPEDSVCVNFGTTLSPIAGCTPSQANSPYKRSFCMATCGSDSDCRGGYKCLAPSDLSAVLAEHSGGSKVCAVSPKPVPSGTSNEVCIGSDADVSPAQGGASSTAGTGGGSAAGEGGASGDDGGSAGAAGDLASGGLGGSGGTAGDGASGAATAGTAGNGGSGGVGGSGGTAGDGASGGSGG